MIQLVVRLIFLLCLALPAQAGPVTVFAAASLRDALTEIVAEYPAEVTLSFSGSGTIARQVAAGAPVDAVVLANRDWVKWLGTRGLLLEDSVQEIAGGRLVLIGGADAAPLANPDADQLLAILQGGRIAIGQRDSVPAGIYARQWLQYSNLWDTLEPFAAETDNVRAALALVALGAAPLGVVYASDAVAEPRVSVLYRVPAQAHDPIRYPAAAITPAGRELISYLTSPQATAIFAKHGFAP